MNELLVCHLPDLPFQWQSIRQAAEQLWGQDPGQQLSEHYRWSQLPIPDSLNIQTWQSWAGNFSDKCSISGQGKKYTHFNLLTLLLLTHTWTILEIHQRTSKRSAKMAPMITAPPKLPQLNNWTLMLARAHIRHHMTNSQCSWQSSVHIILSWQNCWPQHILVFLSRDRETERVMSKWELPPERHNYRHMWLCLYPPYYLDICSNNNII